MLKIAILMFALVSFMNLNQKSLVNCSPGIVDKSGGFCERWIPFSILGSANIPNLSVEACYNRCIGYSNCITYFSNIPGKLCYLLTKTCYVGYTDHGDFTTYSPRISLSSNFQCNGWGIWGVFGSRRTGKTWQ